jgi:2-iminobutanoate/2-iminopropanoate deaminase
VPKNVISTPNAAAPVPGAPYNQGVVAGGFVFTAGQVGIDPATNALVEGGVEAQAERTLDNLEAILEAAGSSLDRVVKATMFLTDMANFGAVNAVYARRIPAPYPARSAFAVRELPIGALVEIEVIAEV